MPSPFPGMDPYLEQETIWHDFHERFLPVAAAQLSAQILPRYIVLIDEHVDLQEPVRAATRAVSIGVLDAPSHVLIPDINEERESFLAVRDRVSRQVVVVIELLSPSNKLPGENRRRYLAKRADLMSTSAHLVEIDLLRGGRPMPAENRPPCCYSVLVSRAGERPSAGFWPIGPRDPLPVVPVPLRDDEPAARLDLRAILDRVYDEAGYRYFLYEHPPDPPLDAEDEVWAEGLAPCPAASHDCKDGSRC